MERRALFACALATAASVVLLRLYMQRFEQEATGGPKRAVIALLRDLEAGATLERDDLGTHALPGAYVESRHIAARELDRLVGLQLAVPGRAGEALLWTDLTSLRRGAPRLASLVPRGMRAFSLSQAAGAADALLSPGDRVDVLSLRGSREPDAPALLVAEGLLVLAVGDTTTVERDGERARGRRAGRGVVTLAVTPEQGLALAAAELGASLRLQLRNPDEIDLTATGAPRAQAVTSAPQLEE